jgi:hypothetical protein
MSEAKEQEPAGWERVLTVKVTRHACGLFMAESTDIKGLFAHGRSIGETLSRVEACVVDLASAGCKQSAAVLDRAGTPQISPVAPVLSSAAISDAANAERLPEPNLGPESVS